MLPENILQSDALDIIFENRNKAYGAYVLRSGYSRRLLISLVLTVIISIIASFIMSFKNKPSASSLSFIIPDDTLHVISVNIKKDEVKPVVKNIQKPQIQTTHLPNAVPVITKDDSVKNDTLKAVENISGKSLSNINAAGINAANPVNTGTGGNEGEPIKTIVESKPAVLEHADVMPQFPGGMEAFMKYMQRNLREPNDLSEGEKIIIKAKFVVEANGKVDEIEIKQNGRNDLDAEVVRVLKQMPQWMPGKENGENVAVYFYVPVTFVATDE